MQRRHTTSTGLVFSVLLFLASCNTPTVTPTTPVSINTLQAIATSAATNEATLAATNEVTASETESATAAPTAVTLSGTTNILRTTFVIADVSATPTNSIAV